MWCHLPTSFRRGLIVLSVLLSILIVAITTTVLFASASHAIQSTNKTINFEGRLLTSAGAVVPDGNYNIQFKIYQDGTGTAAGNPNGDLKWTETYKNSNGTGVQVKNGFLSVSLGSVTPFGTSVDWNADTLWLSMNIAGTAAGCSTFGTSPCVADGEMLPMKRITATPYAINSGALNGKTSDNFVQLGQGVQGDATNNSSIFINKTGTGNLMQLQNNAADIFSIGNTGNISLGSNADKSIAVSIATTDTNGSALALSAGGGGSGSGSSGGNLILQGGAGGGTNGNGGNVQIDAGASTGTGSVGSIRIGTADTGANIIIGTSGTATTGSTAIQSKNDTTIATNGTQKARFSSSSDTLYVGNADESGNATTANAFTIQGTSSTGTDIQGGSLTVSGGSATNGNANGGNVTISGGSGSGSGADGLVVMSTPTFQSAGQEDFAANGALSQANIDGNGVMIANATAANLTITMNDPTIKMAGRVVYVTVPAGSEDFTLSMNGGGANSTIAMKAGTTATLLWNGSDWTIAGATASSTMQDIYSKGTDGNANIRIGSDDDSKTTLLTLDKAASAPTTTDSSLVGSMYYDTTLGQVQCYEANGWGACAASPDTFVSLSPEYSNAVTHGTGIGTLTSDICSDGLNINDGTDDSDAICGTNETHNYYKWTSSNTTNQTKSIYVTYTLPANFKNFVAGSTKLQSMSQENAGVTYEIYKNTVSGLAACSTAITPPTTAHSWQTAVAGTTGTDPSTCNFAAGDSVIFKIDLTANSDASAYAGDLNFAYSNN